MDEHIIHIMGTGPHSIADVDKMNGITDWGLYQVYGHHPVYGRNLVSIGKTITSFSERPCYADEGLRWESGSENHPKNVEYYLGRIIGDATPSREVWNQDIELAEPLLIHAHGPAYNHQLARHPPEAATHGHIRVLNWGAVCSLHREVSGMVWTARGEVFKKYLPYGSPPTQPQFVVPILTG